VPQSDRRLIMVGVLALAIVLDPVQQARAVDAGQAQLFKRGLP
jgi:hypothetical protein